MLITRFAPSPTGLLHLGNAWSFLLAWLIARKASGRIILRIDDIDPLRSKPEHVNEIFSDLQWLGLDWDGEPVFQSSRIHHYEAALSNLDAKGLVYPCFCTRAELRRLANAPHMGEEGVIYPGTCRNLAPADIEKLRNSGKQSSVRIRMPDRTIIFNDLASGPQEISGTQTGGDFPIRRSDGVWAYHLASVVDDGLLGVNCIVRGRDIMPSTPGQLFLASTLGYPSPEYFHHPLLLDTAGERLAKRHHSLSLASLRQNGIPSQQIVGMLGRIGGFHPSGAPCTPGELLPDFAIARVSSCDVRLSASPIGDTTISTR